MIRRFLSFHLASRLRSNRRALSDLAERVAVVDQHGSHTYADLTGRADALKRRLLSHLPAPADGLPPRVAVLCSRDLSYVVSTLAIWNAGACAVPLSLAHPPRELGYFVRDSDCRTVLCSPDLADAGAELLASLRTDGGPAVSLTVLDEEDFRHPVRLRHVDLTLLLPFTAPTSTSGAASVVYTSGTTGPPKGVLVSHGQLGARVAAMQRAWEWTPADVLLNCLPLHHVHGVENCLLTPLASGATVLLLPPGPRFLPGQVWRQMLGEHSPNLFMAVPTMYAKLIAHLRQAAPEEGLKAAEVRRQCVGRFRLMVSGSAPLPDPLLEEWRLVSGHTLLERYGMSELGMALSNPLFGPRLPGHVGRPMPGVEVRIGVPTLDGNDHEILCEADESSTRLFSSSLTGELLVRGPAVFSTYLGRPDATAASFTRDGWFRTGDSAQFDPQRDAFRLLGRSSVDIVKTGGHKVSALDVERRLLGHEALAAAAVVGVADVTYGQRLTALVVPRPGFEAVTGEEVRAWAKARMAAYEVPAEVRVVVELPVNAMGKVDKRLLMREMEGEK